MSSRNSAVGSARRAIVLAAVLVLFAGARLLAQPDATPPTARPIKIASWNAEFFVDSFDDPYVEGSLEYPDSIKSDQSLQLMATVFRRLDADVVVLTETEGEAWARAFADKYIKDMHYTTIIGARDENWCQNVIFMSRVPIGALVSFKGLQTRVEGSSEMQDKFNNRMLVLEVKPAPNYTFLLAAAHLKAGGSDQEKSHNIRLGQIEGLKAELVKESRQYSAANIVVVGDMNCTPDSQEFKQMTAGEPALHSLFEEWGFPPTHPADYPTRHIDMIFANDNMMKEYVPGSAAVAAPLGFETQATVSDHLPVVASFYPEER